MQKAREIEAELVWLRECLCCGATHPLQKAQRMGNPR